MNSPILSDKPLKILMLEDTQEDVYLIQRELKQGGILFTSAVVDSKEAFRQTLYDLKPDVILADHSLPQFNSADALKIHQQFETETKMVIPFILVTGSVSEVFAAQSIKSGADDYILKDRLKRLPTAIRNAIEKAKVKSERLRFLDEIISNEAMMREAEQLAHFGSWQADLLTGKFMWSNEAYRIFGYEPGDLTVDYETFINHIHPDDRQALRATIAEAILNADSCPCEFRIIDKCGKIKHILSNIMVKRNSEKLATQLLGFNLDITQQKIQTEALALQNKQLIEIAWIQSHEVRAPLARLIGLLNIVEDSPDHEKQFKDIWKPLLESAHELDSIVRKIVRKTEEVKGS